MIDTPRARVVVAGIGNPYRHDDAAGPMVAAQVAARFPGVCDIGPLSEPLDLLGHWDEAGLAVVVDAVRGGDDPGRVRVIELAGEAEWPADAPTSTHGIGVGGVLRLARALGQGPQRLVVVGIEGANFSQGEGMSATVSGAIEGAANRVLELIEGVC